MQLSHFAMILTEVYSHAPIYLKYRLLLSETKSNLIGIELDLLNYELKYGLCTRNYALLTRYYLQRLSLDKVELRQVLWNYNTIKRGMGD